MLRLLGTGLAGPEIADRLVVSLNMVRTHTKSIHAKLGVKSRRAAVRRATSSTCWHRAAPVTAESPPRPPHVVIRTHHIGAYVQAMSATRTPQGQPHQPGQYEIRLQGHLDARWSAWFDGLTLTRENDGTTLLQGPVVDQAALHGLLQKVRDVGLPLVSVTHVASEPAP